MSATVQGEVGVLGVDDQPAFLDATREVVVETPGFRWVGGAGSGEDALEAVGTLAPSLVLCDVRMPGMNGFETARHISERHPGVVVVLVSVEEGPALARAAQESGAAVFVRKQELAPSTLRRVWTAHAPGPAG